jgi:hypothetical protein
LPGIRAGAKLELGRRVPDSWLFAKDDATVRILRTDELTFAVCGPGRARRVRSFTDPAQFVDFLHVVEQRLADAGFRFRGYAAERRRQPDRRRVPRGPDRRQE